MAHRLILHHTFFRKNIQIFKHLIKNILYSCSAPLLKTPLFSHFQSLVISHFDFESVKLSLYNYILKYIII